VAVWCWCSNIYVCVTERHPKHPVTHTYASSCGSYESLVQQHIATSNHIFLWVTMSNMHVSDIWMRHKWMRHIWRNHIWMSHIWFSLTESHVTRQYITRRYEGVIFEWDIYECVTVTVSYLKKSLLTRQYITRRRLRISMQSHHAWTRHVMCEWVTSHTNQSYHTWTSHGTYTCSNIMTAKRLWMFQP